MTRRPTKRERVRRKRVYLVLCGTLAAALVLLVLLEQLRSLPAGPGAAEEAVSENHALPEGEPPAPVIKAEQPEAGPPKLPIPSEPAAQPVSKPRPPAIGPPAAKVAIIIDDVGYDGGLDALAVGIPFPLTFSVLPGLENSAASAARLGAAGCEIMLHLPMEPERYPEKNPGPGALFTFMTHEEIRSTIREDILSVPGARGVNNHMGSLFTVREDLLKVVLEELRDKGLFFVDSRTVTGTAAQKVARRLGVPTARRSVFLDNDEDAAAITTQLEQLFRAAIRDRVAIGIGHYRENTLLVLAAEVPKLRQRYPGVELVHASSVVK